MRRLVPDGRTVPLTAVYADLDPPEAGWVAIGMVSGVDGGIAIDGVSQDLGGEADRAAFRALRSLADVVVVGVGTAVAESYRPVVAVHDPDGRRRRGQAERPRLALVTGSGRIEPTARVVSDPQSPPLVLTTERGAERIAERGVAAEVVVLGHGDEVDPAAAVAALAERGHPRVVVEGGPTLNAGWLDAGVVDELFVTVSPVLVGGGGPGLAGRLDEPVGLTLHEARLHGGELVLRYRVSGAGYGAA